MVCATLRLGRSRSAGTPLLIGTAAPPVLSAAPRRAYAPPPGASRVALPGPDSHSPLAPCSRRPWWAPRGPAARGGRACADAGRTGARGGLCRIPVLLHSCGRASAEGRLVCRSPVGRRPRCAPRWKEEYRDELRNRRPARA
jgi:hypothetical protein